MQTATAAPEGPRPDRADAVPGALEDHTELWRFEQWLGANPQAVGYMVALALGEVAKRRRFNVAWLWEEVRKKDFVDSAGDPFKANNNYRAAFARWLLKEHPECERYMVLRRSKFDGLV